MALIILLGMALFAPKMVFSLQDTISLQRINLGRGEVWDITSLATKYEMSLGKRLESFAKGLKDSKAYYVTEVETNSKTEALEYLDEMRSQDVFMTFLQGNSILDYLSSQKSVDIWKRYVVYDENYENGVAFLLGYITLHDENGRILNILLDTETGTIYYLKLESDETALNRIADGEVENEIENTSEIVMTGNQGKIAYIPLEYYDIIDLYEYFITIYEADKPDDLEAKFEVDFFLNDGNSIFLMDAYEGDDLRMKLQYGTMEMEMAFCVGYNVESYEPVFEFGLPEIARLIPEIE